MKKPFSKNELDPRERQAPPRTGLNNSSKSPINMYESNGQGRKVSRVEAIVRQGKGNIFQSEISLNKSAEKRPAPRKPEILLHAKVKPLFVKPKPEVTIPAKYNSKNSLQPYKVGSNTQVSSQIMSPSGKEKFDYTNDSLKQELEFINKGVFPVRIFENSEKNPADVRKRQGRDPPSKHYYSEKDKDSAPENGELKMKLVLKRNSSIVKVRGSPGKSTKKSPSPPRKRSSSSRSRNHSRSFVDARQIQKRFVQQDKSKNTGKRNSPKKINSSVPANKNMAENHQFESRINATNFNMSGHFDAPRGTILSEPQSVLSREHIFKIKEDEGLSELISLIKRSFVDYPSQRFKTSLNFYEMLKILGKGTYGKVYEAQHKLTAGRVAVKCIEKTTIKNEKSMQKIFNEVEILANLSHVNIIKLYEIFENEKYYFFVTEFAEKGDLLRLLDNNGVFNETQVFLILKDLLESVKYLHGKGILHRDIKLDNILLNGRYKVKLCDFGISLKIHKGHILTEKCGTPAYMPPEIIQGRYSGFYADVG
jgi:tRNA A-37 threonylcarbamoyl transferase component Bud32